AAATASLRRAKPDVVIVDLGLSDMHGLRLIETIRSSDPDIRIMVLSAYSETLYGERALRSGADSYVNKQQAPGTIVGAIRATAASGPRRPCAGCSRIAEPRPPVRAPGPMRIISASWIRPEPESQSPRRSYFSPRSAVKPMPRRLGGVGFISSRIAERMAAIAASWSVSFYRAGLAAARSGGPVPGWSQAAHAVARR